VSRGEALVDVVGTLPATKLDYANLGEAARDERILLTTVSISSRLRPTARMMPIARDLAPRDHEVFRRVVLLQECHVRRHLRVDLDRSAL
jgi:hypothetical protein